MSIVQSFTHMFQNTSEEDSILESYGGTLKVFCFHFTDNNIDNQQSQKQRANHYCFLFSNIFNLWRPEAKWSWVKINDDHSFSWKGLYVCTFMSIGIVSDNFLN